MGIFDILKIKNNNSCPKTAEQRKQIGVGFDEIAIASVGGK